MAHPFQMILTDRARQMVADAAVQQGLTMSGLVRRFTYDGLRALGFDPTGVPKFGWGEGRQVALVDGETIVAFLNYNKPSEVNDAAREVMGNGRRLLPIEYRDAVPFDPEKHYRLPAERFVEGDKVIVRYPIIDKSEDVG